MIVLEHALEHAGGLARVPVMELVWVAAKALVREPVVEVAQEPVVVAALAINGIMVACPRSYGACHL